ncbi:hypothetical protein SKAU_G00204510 [Synaphobranchus kaupii]|uniref:Uncharacterized protein n=1 Tax=Synaphobranchus kaupii TaxID=118154 RepID=A0A9Q1FG48_SYNKA|nr:hypothetical protein SKAU_G00204510 [Synaphobranchus kaupii]
MPRTQRDETKPVIQPTREAACVLLGPLPWADIAYNLLARRADLFRFRTVLCSKRSRVFSASAAAGQRCSEASQNTRRLARPPLKHRPSQLTAFFLYRDAFATAFPREGGPAEPLQPAPPKK